MIYAERFDQCVSRVTDVTGRGLYTARGLLLLGLLLFAPFSMVVAGPKIQHWQTSNGARVYFVEARELPMVDVRVVFDAGSARDNGKPGLASLTNRMLMLGAGNLNADQIAQRFDGVGANPGNGSERDMAWVSMRTLSDPKLLTPARDTLALSLSQPSFPAQDFERERQRMLVDLNQQKQSPSDIAEKALYKAVYGDHPYASPPDGTEDGLNGLARDDLVDFYKRYYVAKNAVIAIVGDLDRAGAEQLAGQLVGKLPSGAPAPELPSVKALDGPKTVRIPYPSAQTHVLIGAPGTYRGDPYYIPLYVGNHALGGGGLVSLLSEEIREKRGLAYSVYSYFLPMRRTGPFMMGMQTRTDQTGQGIQLMGDVLGNFIKNGIGKDELVAAQKNITGGFPLRIDSNSKIVGYIAMIGFYGLPLDYLDEFPKKVGAVSRNDVDKAFRHTLNPAHMVTVIVGADQ